MWKERFRILFDQNIAGIILTNVEGAIVDCNEPFAHIFGFESRNDLLAHSAWDLYFDRTEREGLIHRLRSRVNCPAEEVCFRGRNALPIWVLTRRTVMEFVGGQPELLLGTVIDLTAHNKTRTRLWEIGESESAVKLREDSDDQIGDLSLRLGILLQRVTQALQPDNLRQMGRTEIQEFQLLLEEMKMLMSALEIVSHFRSRAKE